MTINMVYSAPVEWFFFEGAHVLDRHRNGYLAPVQPS